MSISVQDDQRQFMENRADASAGLAEVTRAGVEFYSFP
jgi:hypothetical protein